MHGASGPVIASNALAHIALNAVILRRANSEVLLVRNGCQFELPIVIIPKWRRVAQEVTEFTLGLWGLKTICLFQPAAQGSDSGDADHFIVLESRDPSWLPPAGFKWVSREGLQNGLHSITKAQSLQEVLATADVHNDSLLDRPFARAGWFDDLVSWAQREVDPYRLKLTGKFCQLNGDPSFSLVRLETTGPSIWFKAVGEPNRHEFPVTITLAKLFSRYLPTLIAARPSWNGWLTFEAEGTMLDENSDISMWEKAAETLAELQIESVEQTGSLLDASCRDIRVPALLEQIDPFFDVMAELMAQQPKVPPPVLSLQEIHALAAQLKEVCVHLKDLGFPDTLGHLDFNPGNIIAGSDRCVFLDWAEAYVGHPFLTFEYLRALTRRMQRAMRLMKSGGTDA